MKKHLIFYLLSLIFITALPAGAQSKFDIYPVKKIEANPINLASVIVEKNDSDKIASIFEYYGYALQGTENGYQILKHPNGDEIRYSFHPENSDSKYPTIIVKPKETQKQIDTCLKELNFKKEGNKYKRTRNMYSRYASQCEHGPKGSLIFSRVVIR